MTKPRRVRLPIKITDSTATIGNVTHLANFSVKGCAMRTFTGYSGTRAVAELFGRLHDAEAADGLLVELGHTEQGHYLILLTDRDFRVILTTEQAEAVLRSLAAMVRAVPELADDQATSLLGTALVEALGHMPGRHTVH